MEAWTLLSFEYSYFSTRSHDETQCGDVGKELCRYCYITDDTS